MDHFRESPVEEVWARKYANTCSSQRGHSLHDGSKIRLGSPKVSFVPSLAYLFALKLALERSFLIRALFTCFHIRTSGDFIKLSIGSRTVSDPKKLTSGEIYDERIPLLHGAMNHFRKPPVEEVLV